MSGVSEEPIIAVGLRQDVSSLSFRLRGDFTDASGRSMPEGDYRVVCHEGAIRCIGPRSAEAKELVLMPKNEETGRFSLQTTIGVDFHWEQQELQTFSGNLRFKPSGSGLLTAINDVALEGYLTSVICSEMDASSPLELIKAHSVVSRSWLLAQRKGSGARSKETAERGERIRWYDHEAHQAFDVCADDHCQRYHGIDRIKSADATRAVQETRGQVLAYEGRLCDARYSKCCGGVTEDFRVAWSDEEVPYLVPIPDGPSKDMPQPPLTDETAFREFLRNPPDAYCNCTDDRVLQMILTPHDRQTPDFFRWTTRLDVDRASELFKEKSGIDLGRIARLEPVERGLSGRLKRLRFVGEQGDIVIGKELEIRRLLSPTHLYSSAFAVDTEGSDLRPDALILRGAGWGHGVGLCQIGAAVMAWRGTGYEAILAHYYLGTSLEQAFS
jgi:stage II sporulation protein D